MAIRSTGNPIISAIFWQESDMGGPKVFVARRLPHRGPDILREHCDADMWTNEMPQVCGMK
jgi:hypothetical protein